MLKIADGIFVIVLMAMSSSYNIALEELFTALLERMTRKRQENDARVRNF